jgi:hypothetical protein
MGTEVCRKIDPDTPVFSFVRIGHIGTVTEPSETPRHLFRRAARGRDPATPALVIGGVWLVVAGAVAVVLTIAFLIYFLV